MTGPVPFGSTARIDTTALRVAVPDEGVAFHRDVVGLTLQTQAVAAAALGAGDTPLPEPARAPDTAPRRFWPPATTTPTSEWDLAERDDGIEVVDPDEIVAADGTGVLPDGRASVGVRP